MMWKRRFAIAVLAVCVCLAGTIAAVAEDVLRVIPNDALGFVVMNRVGQTQSKLATVADRLHLPERIKRSLDKWDAADREGVDKEGSVAIAAVADPRAPAAPAPVIFVPVTNYRSAIEHFHPEDAAAKIAKVTIGDRPFVVGKKGQYAVLAKEEDKAILESVLDATRSAAVDARRLRKWAAAKDAYAAATPAGIKMAQQAVLAGLAVGKAKIAEEDSEQARMALRAIEVYETLFKTLDQQITHGAVGLKIDGDGDVHISGRMLLARGGTLAKLSRIAGEAPPDVLAGLPRIPFVFAGGGPYPEDWVNHLTDFYVDMATMYMGADAIPESQAERFGSLMRETVKGLRSMGMIMGTVEPGQSLYHNTIVTMQTDDAQKYLDTYGRIVREMGEILKRADSPAAPFDAEEVEVDGLKALKVSMDMQSFLGMQEMPPEAKSMIEAMIGPGSKLDVYAAAADAHTVVMAYISQDRLLETVKGFRQGAASLRTDPNIAKTADMLPAGAQWVGYWSPAGTRKLVAAMLATIAPNRPVEIPEFPSPAPVGFALKMAPGLVDTDLAIPADVLQALPKFFEAMKAPEGTDGSDAGAL